MMITFKNNFKMNSVKMNNKQEGIIIKTGKITIFATMIGLSLISSINKNKRENNISKNTNININIESLSDKKVENKQQETKSYRNIIYENILEICPNYSYVFGLNEEVLSNVVKKYIDNSSLYNLTSNNNILGTNEKYDTLDIQIILIAKELSKNPSQYGYNKEEAYFCVSQTQSYLTIRELVYKYADIFNLDREYMLSIACAESGWFKEKIATKKNNPYGHRKNGKFLTYCSLERGILEGILNLKLNYFTKESDTIDSCAKKYCPDSPEAWIDLVKGVHKKIKNGYTLYDEKNKNLLLEVK